MFEEKPKSDRNVEFRNLFSKKVIRKTRQILCRWGEENYKNYPWRNENIKWHSLIAEMMLQRTRANNVVPIYKKFKKCYPTPKSLSKAPLAKIEKIIYPLGLKWRALYFKNLSKYLISLKGQIPKNLEKLKEIPGVGDYVASAWLGFHGGKRTVIIDANIVRWLCRMLGVAMNGETRRRQWLRDLAGLLTPLKGWKKYNYAVLDFTMTICKKKPLCEICEFKRRFCKYPKR